MLAMPPKKSLAQMEAKFATTFAGLSLAGKSVLDVVARNGGFSYCRLRVPKAMKGLAASISLRSERTTSVRGQKGAPHRQTRDIIDDNCSHSGGPKASRAVHR